MARREIDRGAGRLWLYNINDNFEELFDGMSSKDAFGRSRVSSPFALYDAKQIADNLPLFWDDQEVSGSGTNSTYSQARASSTLAVSATTAGKRARQTFQRFNYQPGKSLLILMTGVLSAGGSGITAAMGYFDDDNGIFIQSEDGTVKLTIRSSRSGSAVDTDVAQSAWNGDKLDGTGASGVTLDPSKAQIFWTDIEWLGVGSVRCGFVIDGAFITCHTFHHANSETGVYMSTANLPLRYEIDNDGTGAATELEAICAAVISEGGSDKLGALRTASTSGTHVDANAADTVYAVVGVRPKSSYLGVSVDIAAMSMISETNDDFEWLLMLNPTVAGTFTYADITNSALQSATGATANTVTGGTPINGGFAKTSGAASEELPSALKMGAAIDGTVDEIVLCVRPLSANADIQGTLTWREQL